MQGKRLKELRGYEDVASDLVVHIELRKWADVAVVAPCSANTLAKAVRQQTSFISYHFFNFLQIFFKFL